MSSPRLRRVVLFGLAFALLLVSAACPAGQPLRGINADGSAAVLEVVKSMNPSCWD